MNAAPYREIACAILIDLRGRLLLQQRDNVAGILHPGKIGLFGGHREDSETFLQCVVREIHEETSYFVRPERFEYLASLDGTDLDVEGGNVRGDFFVTRDIPLDALIITEGAVLVVRPDEIAGMEEKLTPSARFALKAFRAGQIES